MDIIPCVDRHVQGQHVRTINGNYGILQVSKTETNGSASSKQRSVCRKLDLRIADPYIFNLTGNIMGSIRLSQDGAPIGISHYLYLQSYHISKTSFLPELLEVKS